MPYRPDHVQQTMEVASKVNAEGTAMSHTSATAGMSGRSPIVVGLDTSVPSQAALHWAASQARLTGQDLKVVHAVVPWGTYLAAGGYAPVMLPSDSVQIHQRDLIGKLFTEVVPEPNWTLDFVSDDPGPALVGASRSASMLVVGTREHTGWGRVLSGSVSHYCLSHAHCPVVAVPVEQRRDPADAPDASVESGSAPVGADMTPPPPADSRLADAAVSERP